MRRRLHFLVAALACAFAVTAVAQSPRPQPTGSQPSKATGRPSATAQSTAPPTAQPQGTTATALARPQFRPAVLPQGPASLVNRINVQELLTKGQKDGAVQFAAIVDTDGSPVDVATYHALPNCQALDAEVLKELEGAKFTPPIYEHQAVKVLLYGTVLFDADSTPHLRILLNQDPKEIETGKDFIGPQPVIGGDSKFKGLRVPDTLPVQITGVVNLALSVDEKGTLVSAEVASEEPPLLGLADAAVEDFSGARFIPGFLDGDPTASATLVSVCYKPPSEEENPFGLQQTAPPPSP